MCCVVILCSVACSFNALLFASTGCYAPKEVEPLFQSVDMDLQLLLAERGWLRPSARPATWSTVHKAPQKWNGLLREAGSLWIFRMST
jgi:hypothetical protein